MDKNTLTEIAQDEEFIKRLINQDTDEGFKNTLGKKNIDVSLEDAKEIRYQLKSAINGNVNLTDEELDIINGGKASVGDAIKYTVTSIIALGVIAGLTKFGIDVYGNVEDRKKYSVRESFKDWTGVGKDKSTYGRAVDKTGEAIFKWTAGGSGEENRHTKDIKPLTGQEESEEIVKGFGMKNGKLF